MTLEADTTDKGPDSQQSPQANTTLPGRNSTDWKALKAWVTKKSHRMLKSVKSVDQSPFLWGLDQVQHRELVESLEQCHFKLTNGNVDFDSELTINTLGIVDLENTLELLQLIFSLDRFAESASGSQLEELLRESSGLVFSSGKRSDLSVLLDSLLTVELPIALAFQFNMAPDQTDLLNYAVSRFEKLLDENVDGDGWVHANLASQFWLLSASWSRSAAILRQLDVELAANTTLQCEWIARQFVRTMGPDSKQLLGTDNQFPASKSFRDCVIALSSDRVDRKLDRLRSPEKNSKRKDDVNLTLYDESGFSEWAGLGVFQASWAAKSPRLAIAVDETGIQLEVANRISLLKGYSQPQIKLGEEEVAFHPDRFEINCWHTSDEVEFVELEYVLDGGVTLQRQFFMSRYDEFLVIADAIVCEEEAIIEYSHQLPLSPSIELQHESETREVYLRDAKIHAMVMPLALGEWQVDRGPGKLACVDGQLSLFQKARGTGMYAPLFFDLNSTRCKHPRTWRSLTVGQGLETVPVDKAAAYRIQVGKQQWLIYRSLSGVENRTFFGENQCCEFYVGRTDCECYAEDLLQIE